MKVHRDWVLKFALFLGCVLIDQISKKSVGALSTWNTSLPGFFFFESHQNPGFIFQTLSDVSVMARVVFTCSLFALLAFAYFIIQNLLTHPLRRLRIALTLLLGSIAGNSLDRALLGGAIDFICIRTGSDLIYFNFADVIMWLGTSMTMISLVQDRDLIWHPDSSRKTLLINRGLQLRIATFTTLIVFFAFLVLTFFSFTFLTHVLHHDAAEAGLAYLIGISPLLLLFLAITFYFSIVFSHRIAGPLHAFRKFVERLSESPEQRLILRKSDEHKELEVLAEKLRKILQSEN
ncbi:MAG: signal peptidase II [Bdellovibrionales bacterium]|nr:signal peptidase II [Bdellovibrionales bacterium]